MTPYHHRTVFVATSKLTSSKLAKVQNSSCFMAASTGASNLWKHNIGPLAERFHVIAPDMLGWGGDGLYTSPIQRVIECLNSSLCLAFTKRSSLGAQPAAVHPSRSGHEN